MKQFRPPDVERIMFVIKADNRPEVLPKVVLLFHRLNVEIDALYMVRRRNSEMMRMNVTSQSNREISRRIEAHLYKVVQIRSVKVEWACKEILAHADDLESES